MLLPFKKNIEIIYFVDNSLITVRAIYKNKPLGKIVSIINEDSNSITIGDIQCKKNNQGYGSMMMERFIEIAKQKKILYIEGWLSKGDKDHKDRLHHFYGKFGFQIISNDEGNKFADIRLVL